MSDPLLKIFASGNFEYILSIDEYFQLVFIEKIEILLSNFPILYPRGGEVSQSLMKVFASGNFLVHFEYRFLVSQVFIHAF